MRNVSDKHPDEVIVATADTTTLAAAKLMRDHEVSAVVVLDESATTARACIGVVSDRDVVTEVIALELDPKAITVGDLVRNGLTGQQAQTRLRSIVQRLSAEGVRELRLARNGEWVGVLLVEEIQAIAERAG